MEFHVVLTFARRLEPLILWSVGLLRLEFRSYAVGFAVAKRLSKWFYSQVRPGVSLCSD